MLGVTMVAPSAALRSHLELEEGKSTMVSGVLEGLPADQAGLREFDVIIAINGVREADPASIRAFLQEQQAGDQMDLTVIRQGKRRQVTVTLTAYDADAMRDATYKGSGEGAILQNTVRFAPGDVNLRGFMFGPDEEVFKVQPGQRWFDEAQKRLHGAMPQEKSLDQEDQEWTLEPGEQRLDRRMAEIERMLDEVLEKIQGMKKDEER